MSRKDKFIENISITCNDFRTMFVCASDRVVEPHKFVNKSPPIVLVNVGQFELDIKNNKASAPSVKHLPYVLLIGKQR